MGSNGAMGSPGVMGTAGAPGPGQIWKDASGAAIPGSFWFVDGFNPSGGSQGMRMGYVDASGDFWNVSRITGKAQQLGGSLGAYGLEFTTTDCTGTAYYNVPSLPPPHVTFRDAANAFKTLAEGTLGQAITVGSTQNPGSPCQVFSSTDAAALASTAIDALPALVAPDLTSLPRPFAPAIAP